MTPAFASFLNWLDEDPRRYLNFITVKTKQTKPMSKEPFRAGLNDMASVKLERKGGSEIWTSL